LVPTIWYWNSKICEELLVVDDEAKYVEREREREEGERDDHIWGSMI